MALIINPLIRNWTAAYGTRAKDIYCDCCKVFGWDKYREGNFDQFRSLYAKRASREGYSPWFVCYSNYAEGNAYNWVHEVSEKSITQTWLTKSVEMETDKTIRIVFAKIDSLDKNYVFLGMFLPTKIREIRLTEPLYSHGYAVKYPGETVWEKTYTLISDTYISGRC